MAERNELYVIITSIILFVVLIIILASTMFTSETDCNGAFSNKFSLLFSGACAAIIFVFIFYALKYYKLIG